MSNETKDIVQYLSAVGMLVFGASLTTAGFIVDPVGDIHQSVLMVLGQCIIFSGSVFGIGIYIKHKVDSRINKFLHENKS